jgi:hypothetical protein
LTSNLYKAIGFIFLEPSIITKFSHLIYASIHCIPSRTSIKSTTQTPNQTQAY